jgi:hypothetical protein
VSRRTKPAATANPTARPINPVRDVWISIPHTICHALAPSAMRTPAARSTPCQIPLFRPTAAAIPQRRGFRRRVIRRRRRERPVTTRPELPAPHVRLFLLLSHSLTA